MNFHLFGKSVSEKYAIIKQIHIPFQLIEPEQSKEKDNLMND